MAILDIIKKANRVFAPTKEGGKPRTPAEIELASFEERERLDNVKKKLAVFRKQNSDEIFRGKPMTDENTILQTESPKRSISLQKNTILGGENTLLKNKNILKGGRNFL